MRRGVSLALSGSGSKLKSERNSEGVIVTRKLKQSQIQLVSLSRPVQGPGYKVDGWSIQLTKKLLGGARVSGAEMCSKLLLRNAGRGKRL